MDVKQKTDRVDRLAGLRRFAVAITILNVLGHLWFGFEQSFATPFVAVGAAYATELILELVDAFAMRRPLRIQPTFWGIVDFFLSAHITGLACGMLLYANNRLWVVAFGASAAIASKAIFRIKVGKEYKHFFNPSNLGISVVLLTFPWVGIVPPYHFTENLGNVGTWVLPAVIVCSGSLLNTLFTKRIPLAVAWVTAYFLQAAVRTLILGTPFLAGIVPMTGVAFLLFTFYMVTDPATTPRAFKSQILFGASVAAIYSILVYAHIVFGMFFALALVCAIRGGHMYWVARHAPVPMTTIPGDMPMPALQSAVQAATEPGAEPMPVAIAEAGSIA